MVPLNELGMQRDQDLGLDHVLARKFKASLDKDSLCACRDV